MNPQAAAPAIDPMAQMAQQAQVQAMLAQLAQMQPAQGTTTAPGAPSRSLFEMLPIGPGDPNAQTPINPLGSAYGLA
jgi:hypothetical protein